MKYIALLRGVNVGGNNIISMRGLQAGLTAAGFAQVSTYINSGNVLFESAKSDKNKLTASFSAAMEQSCGFSVPLALLSADELAAALDAAPPWWGADDTAKHNAIFIIAPATAKEVADSAGEIKPQYESLHITEHIIFWSAPLATFSRTRWSKVVGSAAYQNITIRNANTAKKLRQLAGS